MGKKMRSGAGRILMEWTKRKKRSKRSVKEESEDKEENDK
jgi:hypothetical protein